MQLPSTEFVEARIDKTIGSIPDVDVLSFGGEEAYRPSFLGGRLMSKASAILMEAGVVSLPKRSIAAIQTGHCYIEITNFDALLTDSGRESEEAAQKICALLHGWFQSADVLTDGTSVQRVDFHGGRIHVVVVSNTADPCSIEMLAQLVSFARAIREILPLLVYEVYGIHRNVDTRAGIDAGPCLAWDDGDADGAEPLFLGSPANHAAKIAARSQTPGIYLSERVVNQFPSLGLGTQELFAGVLTKGGSFYRAPRSLLNMSSVLAAPAQERRELALAEGLQTVQKGVARQAKTQFIFSLMSPPLRDVRFKNLSPSKSIRMEMAVIFADIDGFTAFVDECIQTGQLAVAAKYIYVLRKEMAAVVKDDCRAKKVRFIGDCVQAVIAAGTARSIDDAETVRQAVLTATALQRSVKICASRLKSKHSLAVSIGIEFGKTPLTRAGIRGERAVRLSCSNASRVAEREQNDCLSGRVKLGPHAARAGAKPLRLLLERNDTMSIENTAYITASLKRGLPRPAIQAVSLSARSSSVHLE